MPEFPPAETPRPTGPDPQHAPPPAAAQPPAPGSAAPPAAEPAPVPAGWAEAAGTEPGGPPPPPFGPQFTGPGDPPAGFTPPPVRRFDWGRLLRLTGVIAPIVVGAVVIMLTVGTSIGPAAFAVGLAVAVIPVPFLVGCFLWLDRYEPEPWKYLAFAFGWGSCVATAVALGGNTLASYVFVKSGLTGAGEAVLGAPFVEETMKGIGPVLLVLYLRRRRQTISVVDGIVYFGLAATGFAMAENILYLGGIYVTGSQSAGLFGGAVSVAALAAVRIGVSGFAHPLFTSMTGIGFGLSSRATDKRVRYLAPLAGWIGAMCLHATWNLLSSLGPTVLVIGYLAVMAPVFFAAVGVALWARGYEGRQVVKMLPPYVRAGWLTPPEVAALQTVNRRMAARRWASRVAGEQGAQAMRAYQFALTKLAMARDAELRGAADPDFPALERRLLTEADSCRRVFAGRDPAMPPVFWDGVAYHIRFPDGSVRKFPPPPQPVVPVPVTLGYSYGYQQGWR